MSPSLAPTSMNAAITSVYSVIADCTPWIDVSRSLTICEIDTFITLESSTITNCAAARIMSGSHLRIRRRYASRAVAGRTATGAPRYARVPVSRTGVKMRRLAALASIIAALALPSVALAASSPVGTYTATIKTPAALKGTWVLSFKKGGTYAISDNGAVVVRGHFTSTPRVSLSKETGPAACPQVGTYTWKRAGKKVTFSKVSDPCPGRSAVLSHPFTATS